MEPSAENRLSFQTTHLPFDLTASSLLWSEVDIEATKTAGHGEVGWVWGQRSRRVLIPRIYAFWIPFFPRTSNSFLLKRLLS